MPGKILVVDDSASMRQILTLILGQAGYQADAAADGPSALAALTPEHRLAIIDYNMPGMNGIELITLIRGGTVNKSLPILVVTTEYEEARKLEAKGAGATGWITKPFDQDALVNLVRRLVDPIEF
jgi:two-component system chemotaxis response regulator CheY